GSVELPPTDMDGDPRTSNGAIDIGADEYSVRPVLSLSPRSLTLDPITRAPQTVTLHNGGASATAIHLITANGGLTQPNTCGPTLKEGESCTIEVTPEFGTGALSVMTDATEMPLVALLHARVPPWLYAAGAPFYDVQVGTPQQRTGELYNFGDYDLVIS